MEPHLLLLFLLLSWFRLFLHLFLLLLPVLFLCAPEDMCLPLMPPETAPTTPSQIGSWMRMATKGRMMR